MPPSRIVNDLPLVLCGPMLRRVTERSVCVFVALQHASEVTLRVYDRTRHSTRAADALLAEATATTVALGARLHVLALDARLDDTAAPLAPGVLYEYDLAFEHDGQTDDLRTDGLLEEPCPLGYSIARLPSFALPPSRSDLNIVHGSCRMPHGEGFDMLAAVDTLIEADLHAPLKRPHQLLLTGDQIYADDVSVSVLDLLMTTADQLLDWDEPERIPLDSASDTVDAAHEGVQPGIARGDFMQREAKLTSGELDGHLLFLGEYFAMYLLAWSPAIWPKSQGADDPLPFDLTPARDAARGGWVRPSLKDALVAGAFEPSSFHDPEAKHTRRRGTLTTLLQAKADRMNARLFARTLPNVRRALANVPTLMLFDDHEVTDDWYLNGGWDTAVRSSATGRRVMRNGLAAYAVFQDWGNHPENYLPGQPGADVLEALHYDPAAAAPPLGTALEDLLDVGLPAAQRPGRAARMCWDWTFEWQDHRIVALDTRTWREFSAAAPRAGARLMSAAALDAQLPATSIAKLTIVVSPPPVIGFPFVEEGLQRFLVQIKNTADFDNEPWGANRAAFENLLHRLAGYQRVVLLGGDVHYAFSNHCAYFRDDGSAPAAARIVQLCSTSLKHATVATRANGWIGSAAPVGYGWLGWNSAITGAERVALLAACAHLGPVLALMLVEDRLAAPAVLPATRWVDPVAAEIVSNLAGTPQSPRTDWRYQVTFVRDAGLGHGTVVGLSNVARISFPGDEVEQRILWLPDAPGVSGAALPVPTATVHRLPLSIPDASERPEVRTGE